MNSKEMKEQISALVDSELPENALGAVLVGLRNGDEHAAWDMYHQIGDVLRSDEMAISLSSGFAARMQARLDAEPVFIAPAATGKVVDFAEAANGGTASSRKVRRFAVPGMAAAAAIAALAFVAMPQAPSGTPGLASAGSSAVNGASTTVATAAAPSAQQSSGSSIMLATGKSGAPSLSLPGLATLAQQGEVVRDPRIDDYLLAHQRFSNSDSNSAQYTRPAAFAVEAEK